MDGQLEAVFPRRTPNGSELATIMVNLGLDINLVVLSKLFIGKPTCGDDPIWTNTFSTGFETTKSWIRA